MESLAAILRPAFKGDGSVQNIESILLALVVLLVLELVRRSFFFDSDKGADISTGLRREQKDGKPASAVSDDRVLHPLYFKPFTVIKKTKVSHNTVVVRFEIPSDRDLGLSVGRHVSVKAEIDGNKVIRPYTPTSRPDTKGYFELMVKHYRDGKMSSHIWELEEGDTLDFRGPVGRFVWNKNRYKRIGLIAGGTGLTPCLQVIRCLLEGPEGNGDNTELVLFFQNRTEEDILLEQELRELAFMFKHRLRVLFFLSNPRNEYWGKKFESSRALRSFFSSDSDGQVPQIRGYITQAAVKAALAPDSCPLVGVCGPSGFNDAMKELLVAEGHDSDGDSIFIW